VRERVELERQPHALLAHVALAHLLAEAAAAAAAPLL